MPAEYATPSPAGLLDRLTALLTPAAGLRAGEEAALLLDRVRPLPPEEAAHRALDLAARRARGAPLALLVGRQRFLGLDLLTREDVLAPREESELLAREALAVARSLAGAEVRLADLGCGAGNLACALACHEPRSRVWASDLAAPCVALTRENAALHHLEGRIRVAQGDLFGPLEGLGLEGGLDLVVMNPPYIPSASLERNHASLLQFEPREAFDGGPYGLTIIGRLLQEAPAFLKPGGHLLLEFGEGQERLVATLADRSGHYAACRLARTPEGRPRVAVLRRPEAP